MERGDEETLKTKNCLKGKTQLSWLNWSLYWGKLAFDELEIRIYFGYIKKINFCGKMEVKYKGCEK